MGGGEFLALLGQNGSGKTTLLRALLGLQSLTRGRIDVLGTPVADFGDWHRIGYVPQNLLAAGAVPVSVREVVAAGLISPAPTGPDPIEQRCLLRPRPGGVGRSGVGCLPPLSGGQQRRAMIASVLAKGQMCSCSTSPPRVSMRPMSVTWAKFCTDCAMRGDHRARHPRVGVLADLVGRVVVLGPGGTSSIPLRRPTSGPGHDAGSPWPPRAAFGPAGVDPMNLLSYDFMQRALIASLIIGLLAPMIGVFLVQRRLALLGDGMGHVALTGWDWRFWWEPSRSPPPWWSRSPARWRSR